MKLPDFINSLASKCGKQNDQAIIDILSRSDLQNIDLADEVANAINNSLLTVDAAKNNIHVKNHFNALALGSVDAEILNTIKKLELGDEFETEISGLKNTYEKQRKLAEKIKESIDNIKAVQGSGDPKAIEKAVEKYVKQINDLNSKIAKLNEETVPKDELEKVKTESDEAVKNYMIHSKIAGLKFANDKMTTNANVALANVLLSEGLKQNKAVIMKEGNDLVLRNAEDPKLYHLDAQNKTVTFDDFMNKILAENHVLAVSDTKQSNTPSYTPIINQNNPVQGQQMNYSKFDAAVNIALNGEN